MKHFTSIQTASPPRASQCESNSNAKEGGLLMPVREDLGIWLGMSPLINIIRRKVGVVGRTSTSFSRQALNISDTSLESGAMMIPLLNRV